jgi:ferritin-like protein
MRSGPRCMETLESIRDHLQWALELELFTVPPYLCALYSLDADKNPEAEEVVQTVMVEEMIHMGLVANLLNAVGGQPRLDAQALLQPYPRPMPHGDRSFEVPLLGFSQAALDVFAQIEQPERTGALPEQDGYETIGQFYASIRRGLVDLCQRMGEANVFCGDTQRQLSGDQVGTRVCAIFHVRDLDSALAALDEIVDQGEGAGHSEVWDGDVDVFHPEREQVAHFYRFRELQLGRRYQRGDSPQSGPTGAPLRVDWGSVWRMRPNPRTSDHAEGSPIRLAQEAFNRCYCSILRKLERGFSGDPEQLQSAIAAMFALKGQAVALMQMVTEDGVTTAGPTFEYVPPGEGES